MTTCDNISILFQLWNIFRVCSLSLCHTLHETSCVDFVRFFPVNRRQNFPSIEEKSTRTTDFLDILIKFQFSCHVWWILYVSWGNATIVAHLSGRNCFRISLTDEHRFILDECKRHAEKGLIYTIVMNFGVKLIIFILFLTTNRWNVKRSSQALIYSTNICGGLKPHQKLISPYYHCH